LQETINPQNNAAETTKRIIFMMNQNLWRGQNEGTQKK
jgi:hypothetical protein